MSSSECAGESGSDSTSAPARSATGTVGARKRSRYHASRCTGRKWMLVPICSSASARWYSSRVAPARSGVDADDVEVERVHVARVARERRDPVELGDAVVVERELPLADLAMPLELVELDERDRREHVGEVRLVAGHGDVVERAVAAAHQPQLADRVGDVVAVRRDRARPRRRRRSSSRRARSTSRRRARRSCGRGTRSRTRARRPRSTGTPSSSSGSRSARLAREVRRAGSPSSAR